MEQYKHITPIQIRFKDIDKLGHVNNANHLSYFEVARMHYSLDVLGKIDWSKIGFILANAHVEYKRPLLLEHKAYVRSRVSEMGNKSFKMEYILAAPGEDGEEVIFATGYNVCVCMDYEHMKPIPVPDSWKECVRRFESV
ncbi:MAG TPA: thioesterase family protein [Bacteroidia bacterium]|jgi:acyl-CoA thioester hydrolase|nr:thioesterase family protein [Bacteroidia bacterium]